jgi:hypothetical protein
MRLRQMLSRRKVFVDFVRVSNFASIREQLLEPARGSEIKTN